MLSSLLIEHRDKISKGVYFLWKANSGESQSGFIIRREVGRGFLKLNNKGSVVLVLPESYTINTDIYTQINSKEFK